MKEKYNLKEMMDEIKEDEGSSLKKTKKMSQEEIKKLLAKRGKKKENSGE